MGNYILVKGAREHNLKNISVKIPKNKLVVFAGVSGSGKSSLAIDTLYAEGQRRYVESLSTYARQFLGVLPRPVVDEIQGLSPSIAIDQHGLSHNPRSTVGTVTEIYDYLRVLFARIGHPHCPQCGREIARQTSSQITRQIIELVARRLKSGSFPQLRLLILAPVVRDKRGEFNKLFDNLRHKGFEQVRVDGWIYNLNEDFVLIKTNRHNIEVVVDRIVCLKKQLPEKKLFQRILQAVAVALDLSSGLVVMSEVKDASFNLPTKPRKMIDHLFSSRFACPICNLSLPEIEPRIFSFNSPFGACPECNGLGVKLKIDPSRVSNWRAAELERRYYTTTSDIVREEIGKLMIKEPCLTCHGSRLKKESLAVTIDNYSIAQVSSWHLKKLFNWINNLKTKIDSKSQQIIARPLINQISNYLSFLISVGVEYLTLDRNASTLSVGEGQRIRLASQVGSGLSGILYLLDEPTVGLHARDTQRLIKTLKKLRDLGNTLVVVEHDPEILRTADWILDFGPKAGKEGGQVVAQGTPVQIKQNRHSLTGQYLSGRKKIPFFPTKKLSKKTNKLKISGCRIHNLKNITVEIPLGQLTCVTGVSGSGKSSLVMDTIYPLLKKQLVPEFRQKPGKFNSIFGAKNIARALMVSQSPVGKTSRSNPATYTGVFTDIRQLFAQTRDARVLGFTQTHFSFNTEGGRCEACRGQGQLRVQMQFLPDVWVKCDECQGKRFKKEVLEVEFKGKNIAQVLELTIVEALAFFQSVPKIVRKLEILERIGLGYLELGQVSPTLSGGESQRLKLARELVKKSEGKTIYF